MMERSARSRRLRGGAIGLAAASLVGLCAAPALADEPAIELQQISDGAVWSLAPESPTVPYTVYMLAPKAGTGHIQLSPLNSCASLGSTEMTFPTDSNNFTYALWLKNLDFGRVFGQTVDSGPNELTEGCSYLITFSYVNTGDSPGSTSVTVHVDSATIAPTLTSPTTSSSVPYGSIPVNFTVPEPPNPSNGHVTFVPEGSGCGTTTDLTLASVAVGPNQLTLNGAGLFGSPNVQSLTGPNALTPGCVYTVSVSYQDQYLNPSTGSSASHVQIGAKPSTTTYDLPLRAKKSIQLILRSKHLLPPRPFVVRSYATSTPTICSPAPREPLSIVGRAKGTCKTTTTATKKVGSRKVVRRIPMSLTVG